MKNQTEIIDPAGYRRTPWKNGGGITIDIADAFRDGAMAGDWDGMIWRFGRTTIAKPGPFSHLSGFDRMQVVVRGHGLVLCTPNEDIDVRQPFKPVRFQGGTSINSRLEAGPVDVVNLMGDCNGTQINLQVLEPGAKLELAAGIHILYAAADACEVTGSIDVYRIERDWALRLDTTSNEIIEGRSGRTVVGSVFMR